MLVLPVIINIFKNSNKFKEKSISITETIRASRIGKLKADRQLNSFPNVSNNNNSIYIKVEDANKQSLNHAMDIKL